MSHTIALTVVHSSVSDPDRFLTPVKTRQLPFTSTLVRNAGELLHHLRDQRCDALLLQEGGPVSIEQARQIADSSQCIAPIIIITEQYDRARAMEQMNQGAFDVVADTETEQLVRQLKQIGKQHKNLSLLKRMEKKQRFCEMRFERLLYNIREPVAYLHAGTIVFHNPAFTQLLQSKTRLIDTPILDAISPDDRAEFKQAIRQCSRTAGQTHPESIKIRARSRFSTDQDAVELVLQTVDQQEDPLIQITGLPQLKRTVHSRDTLQSNNHERLRQMIEQRLDKGQAGSLIFLQPTDLETHKQNVGFTTLEKLLNHAASRLLKKSRHQDEVYRLSGSLFAILSNQQSVDSIRDYGQHLLQTLDGSYSLDNEETPRPVELRFSAGCTLLDPQYGCNKLIMQADTALLIAKREKTGLHLFETERDQSASQDNSGHWRNQTRELIDNNQLKLAFQPITTLHAHPEQMYDVLLRTEDEHQLPLEYIQAVQASDLEQALDHWVLEHTMKELETHRNGDSPLILFTRLSVNTLGSVATAEALKKAFLSKQLQPQQLVIKIRAHDFQDHADVLHRSIPAWAACGFRLAVEHVGRNNVDAGAFASYPLDFISMDRHLISDLATNRHHQLIFQQLMAQCNELDLPIIAVGVQNADTLAMLWESGVNYIQGYYIQQPAFHLDFHNH